MTAPAASSDPSRPFGLAALGQIAVTVRDVERATTFYRDVLGIPFLFSAPPGMAFFDCAGTRLLLGTAETPEQDHPSSILYFRVSGIAEVHRTLAARGVEFVQEPHAVHRAADHELWLSFFRDGEGNTHALMEEIRDR